MNEAIRRFLDEMGAVHAERCDRDISPILFKADDKDGGPLFELTLPKGEPHPYWRVREREMTSDEVVSLAGLKASQVGAFGGRPGIGFTILGSSYRLRGYVYNARVPTEWNISVDDVSVNEAV